MVRLVRVELTTPSLGEKCSIQLSYNRSTTIYFSKVSLFMQVPATLLSRLPAPPARSDILPGHFSCLLASYFAAASVTAALLNEAAAGCREAMGALTACTCVR